MANAAQSAAANALQGIDDLDDEVSGVYNFLDNAYLDGIIDIAEARAIEKYIKEVNKDKLSLEASYSKVYTNPYLPTGAIKDALLDAKITLFGAIDDLVTAIQTAIADGKMNYYEKSNIDSLYGAYATARAAFTTSIEDANRLILTTIAQIANEAMANANLARAITDKFGTSINGGLISSVIMLLREATPQDGTSSEDPGINTAGISGIQGPEENLPAFWAGGTYQDAVAGIAKAIIRHSGRARFTNAEISGEITLSTAQPGHETGARIQIDGVSQAITLFNSLNEPKTIISPDNIPALIDLLDTTGNKQSSIALNLYQTKVFGEQTWVGYASGSVTITIPVGSGRKYTIVTPPITLTVTAEDESTEGIMGVNSNIAMYLYNYNTGQKYPVGNLGLQVGRTEGLVTESKTIASQSIIVDTGGQYRIRYEAVINANLGNGSIDADIAGTMYANVISSTNRIGNNGMALVNSGTDYLYNTAGTFQLRKGQYILQITSSGIKKSTDGGSSFINI